MVEWMGRKARSVVLWMGGMIGRDSGADEMVEWMEFLERMG